MLWGVEILVVAACALASIWCYILCKKFFGLEGGFVVGSLLSLGVIPFTGAFLAVEDTARVGPFFTTFPIWLVFVVSAVLGWGGMKNAFWRTYSMAPRSLRVRLVRLIWMCRERLHVARGADMSLGSVWMEKMHPWWDAGRDRPWVPESLRGNFPRGTISCGGTLTVGLVGQHGNEPVFAAAVRDMHGVTMKDSASAGLSETLRLVWDHAGPPGRDPMLWSAVEEMVGAGEVQALVLEFAVTT